MAEKIVAAPLQDAGIIVNGNRPFDIKIHDERLYGRILRDGVLGFGEAYMDGWWDCEDPTEFVSRLLMTGADRDMTGLTGILLAISQKLLNPQNPEQAHLNVQRHYDLGNDLYQAMLDPRLVYTCGYWRTARTLEEAQIAKLELVCRKLGLREGDRVLDIGCGWGSFAKFAAEHYGVSVVGITLSPEQIELGTELCQGLPIDLRLMDYRDLPVHFAGDPFDHVVSLGMFEHVGPKNYRTYMETAKQVVKPQGLFLLHTIGDRDGGANAWIDRYIFPGGYLPNLAQITEAVHQVFVVEDLHNFGADYDRTLCAWYENFEAAWPALSATGKYEERFRRMWRLYLLSCAATFRIRKSQLWQFVLSPMGVPGGYQRVS